MRALHLGSVWSQILVFAVLATLIPTIVTTVVSHQQNRELLTETIAAELQARPLSRPGRWARGSTSASMRYGSRPALMSSLRTSTKLRERMANGAHPSA